MMWLRSALSDWGAPKSKAAVTLQLGSETGLWRIANRIGGYEYKNVASVVGCTRNFDSDRVRSADSDRSVD